MQSEQVSVLKYLQIRWLFQLGSEVSSVSDNKSRGHKFESQLSHILFLEIDHEIISTVILLLPLIQEEQESVTGKSICTSTGQRLRRLSLPLKSVSRLTDQPDLNSVDWAVKIQLKQTNLTKSVNIF